MKVLKNYSFRDHIRKKNFQRLELKRLLMKSLVSNKSIDLNLRYAFAEELSKFKSTRLRNRCLFNFESSAVFSKLRISRIPLRSLFRLGLLSGFRKK